MCNTTVISSGPARLRSISLNTAPPKTTVRQREKTTTPSTTTVQRKTTTKPEKEQIATLPNTLRPSPSGIESKGSRKPGSQRNVTPPAFLSDGNTRNVSDTTTNGKHGAHLWIFFVEDLCGGHNHVKFPLYHYIRNQCSGAFDQSFIKSECSCPSLLSRNSFCKISAIVFNKPRLESSPYTAPSQNATWQSMLFEFWSCCIVCFESRGKIHCAWFLPL